MLAGALTLIALGIVTIYAIGNPAAPQNSDTQQFENLWKKQIVFAAIAFIAYITVNIINYRRLGRISYWLYALSLLLLAVLLLDNFIDLPFVPVINNARRWLKIHPDLPSIQPSEFCKITYIIALAWYLRYRSNYRNFKALFGPFILTILPMFLILLEPDLGTVLLMLPTLFIMLFIAGAKIKHLLIIIFLALLVSPLLWMRMNNYQKIRISSVILQNEWVQKKAEQHPVIGKILVGEKFSKKQWENDWGYHLIRSKYAVAAGGLKGNGFAKGPFIKYNFLPERHNDFIFAAIAQQWGFYGCLIVIALYIIIITCGLEIAANNTDPFGRLLATGIVIMFTIEVIVNISMTLGLMPITGLTLPLVSYGGSSILVNMLALGLLNNVGRCRPFSVARKLFQ